MDRYLIIDEYYMLSQAYINWLNACYFGKADTWYSVRDYFRKTVGLDIVPGQDPGGSYIVAFTDEEKAILSDWIIAWS